MSAAIVAGFFGFFIVCFLYHLFVCYWFMVLFRPRRPRGKIVGRLAPWMNYRRRDTPDASFASPGAKVHRPVAFGSIWLVRPVVAHLLLAILPDPAAGRAPASALPGGTGQARAPELIGIWFSRGHLC